MKTLEEEITSTPSNYITLTTPGSVYRWANFVTTAIITFPPGVERVEPALQARLTLWRAEVDGVLLASEDLQVNETSDESFIDGRVVKKDGQYKVEFVWNCRVTDIGTHYFVVTFQGRLPNDEFVPEVEAKSENFSCSRCG